MLLKLLRRTLIITDEVERNAREHHQRAQRKGRADEQRAQPLTPVRGLDDDAPRQPVLAMDLGGVPGWGDERPLGAGMNLDVDAEHLGGAGLAGDSIGGADSDAPGRSFRAVHDIGHGVDYGLPVSFL